MCDHPRFEAHCLATAQCGRRIVRQFCHNHGNYRPICAQCVVRECERRNNRGDRGAEVRWVGGPMLKF